MTPKRTFQRRLLPPSSRGRCLAVFPAMRSASRGHDRRQDRGRIWHGVPAAGWDVEGRQPVTVDASLTFRPDRKRWAGSAIGVAALFVLLEWAVPVLAAGDPEAGHRLARAWCAGCHGVEPDGVTSPDAHAPPFRAAARQVSTTEMALHAFLNSPHPTMPNLALSSDQTDDLAAYILSLRGKSR